MATVRLFLDKRRVKEGLAAPIRLMITHNRTTTTQNTDVSVLPEQWEPERCEVINHPNKKMLNMILTSAKLEWEMAAHETLRITKENVKDAKTLRLLILRRLNPDKVINNKNLFMTRFLKFMDSKNSPGTRRVYNETAVKLRLFDRQIEQRTFEDINKEYLQKFEKFLMLTSPSANARAIHLRNIRAVFNDALDDEITTAYPFRKFKIKQQATPKRSLSVEELRTLMKYPCEDWQVIYRDMFMLMFYLCGVNAADLFTARPSALSNGRLEYIRAKTGKPYSIKVEPEAMEIIDRYRGKDYLLNILDTRKDYKTFLHKMGAALKKIGGVERSGLGGKKTVTPLFPKLSQYWCRHTWATIAASLDIPKETIAAGLGHGGNTVTDIYIRFDQRKVDDANRKVLDYVFDCAR